MSKKKSLLVRFLLKGRQWFSSIFFDPLEMLMKWRALPVFFKNMYLYSAQKKQGLPSIQLGDMYYTTYEKYMPGGTVGGIIFYRMYGLPKKYFNPVASTM
jgi:hypothetical protein